LGHIRLIDADAVRRVVRCRLHNECGIATSVAPLEGGHQRNARETKRLDKRRLSAKSSPTIKSWPSRIRQLSWVMH